VNSCTVPLEGSGKSDPQLSFAQARWMRVQASFSASVEVA
jgi:hypothetical protein